MKTSISNLGNVLKTSELKQIQGGWYSCFSSMECPDPYDCCSENTCINTAYAIVLPYCS